MTSRRLRTTALGFLAATLGLLFLGFACKPPQAIVVANANGDVNTLSPWFLQEPTITFERQPDGTGNATITVLTKPNTTVTATITADAIFGDTVQTKPIGPDGQVQFFWPYSRGGNFTYKIEVGSNGFVVATYDGIGYSR